MTEASEPIPEDVMQRAVRLVDDLDVDWTWDGCLSEERGKEEMQAATEAIARAFMEERRAERERCAKIIDSHYDSPRYTEWAYLTACADNRAAIRGQP